jgi:cell wall-associated NlpC family hydrolase
MGPVRTRLVDTARSCLGVPFRHHGRTRAGLDCAGLLLLARQAALGPCPDERGYPDVPPASEVLRRLRASAEAITRDKAGPGDLVLLAWGTATAHLGLFTGLSVIHASAISGKVVETAMPGNRREGRAVGFYRITGVTPWRS